MTRPTISKDLADDAKVSAITSLCLTAEHPCCSYKWGETALVAPPELLACAAQLVEEAMWDETSGIANNEVRLPGTCSWIPDGVLNRL